MRVLLRRRKLDAEMSEEMRMHLEMLAEKKRATGMSAEEARFAARREFGGVEQVKERCRDERGFAWLEHFWRDLRFAARGLRKNPGFTFVVVAVLAVGIGANSAVFSIIDALMLRPLPVADPGRLMVAAATGPVDAHKRFPYSLFDRTGTNFPMPYPFFGHFREQSRTVDVAAVSGWTVMRPLAVAGGDDGHADSVNIEEVSGNYFSMLGVGAVLGRTLLPEDDAPGKAASVAVISYEFWRQRFDADPAVLGRILRLDNFPLTIVGVAARRFSGARVGNAVALWVPINLSAQIDANAPWGAAALSSATTPWINLLVWRHRGVSAEQATAELDLIYQRKLVQMDPQRVRVPGGAEKDERWLEQHLALLPAGNGYAGVRSAYRQPASILMAIVLFMQLVACANVTGLLLARGARRQREFALRATLGASRARLVGQMLTESLLLAGIAGAIGLLLAEAGTRLLANAVAGVRLWADWRTIGFTSVVTLVTGLTFGLVSGWRLSRDRLAAGIREADGPRRQWLNTLLVIGQVGLALVLLVVAGLFTRTLYNLVHADMGFQREQRVLFDLNIPSSYQPTQRNAFYQRTTEAIAALPGVDSVSPYQGFEVLGDTAFVLGFAVDGYVPPLGEEMYAKIGRVGPHFFRTMGIPIVRGRDFGRTDDDAKSSGSAPLVMSEWSARRLFGDANPIGRHIKMRDDFEVVGVARDVKYHDVRENPGFVFYMPLAMWPNEYRVTFVVRTRGRAATSAGELRSAVQTIDARAQISSVRTIAERLDQNVSRDRLIARLAEFFGALAVVFASLGLFGLMSFSVGQRTKEFGVRLALGAAPGDILGAVIWRGLLLGVMGSGVGMVGAWGLTGFISGLLYEVPSTDPLTFVLAAFGLMLIVLLASVLPARRAAKVDPMVALRCE
ncbi:MAG TPA: ABC transporter permease [Opitutus sp.]|nr:ABC transporter permease [Opitutus sp.]